MDVDQGSTHSNDVSAIVVIGLPGIDDWFVHRMHTEEVRGVGWGAGPPHDLAEIVRALSGLSPEDLAAVLALIKGRVAEDTS